MPSEPRTEREAELSTILETTVRGILTVDDRGVIESLNPAAQRLFGYRAEEVIRQPLQVILPALATAEEGGSFAEVLGMTGQEADVIHRELLGRRQDGSTFPVELAAGEMKVVGQRKYVAILQDITNWKTAEAALRQERDFAEELIDIAPVIVLLLDARGRIVRFNRYLEQVTGYRLEEVRGQDWLSAFVPARERPRVTGMFETAVGGAQHRGNVNPIVTRDGTEREIEWHSTPLKEPDGAVNGILSIGRDITDSRRLEQEYLHAQKMEAVGRLAGGIAHDFNNLMMGIVGCADMSLTTLAETDPARRYVEESRAAAKRAVALARQLLDFSRKQPVKPTSLDLDDVVNDSEAMLARVLEEEIALDLRLAGEGRAVFADRAQIEQILMNLVVNARDAMPNGGVLAIETATREVNAAEASEHSGMTPGSYVTLTVTDSGVGIAETTLSKIFEPFFTTKDVGAGTGLGLSTVYGIVHQLGGHIDVESRVGEGTLFRIFFIRHEASGAEQQPVVELEASPGGDETVLVVEDEPLVRLTIRHYLQDLGYDVVEAGDGQGAQAAWEARDGAIDLLLVDVMMPGESGPRVASRLRALEPSLEVLFMSVYPADLLLQQGRLGSGAAFIEKPFSEHGLAVAVRTLLDGSVRNASTPPANRS